MKDRTSFPDCLKTFRLESEGHRVAIDLLSSMVPSQLCVTAASSGTTLASPTSQLPSPDNSS